jgi:hypothetical protein
MSFAFPFGRPEYTTFGQVITVPDSTTTLDKFSFWLAHFSGSGSLVMRAEVYAWDGTKATGSDLYESAPRTISDSDTAYHRQSFTTGGVSVAPGQKYVIFASVAKDYKQCTSRYFLIWAALRQDGYPGGTYVYQRSGADPSQWTQSDWRTSTVDLAFKAYLS